MARIAKVLASFLRKRNILPFKKVILVIDDDHAVGKTIEARLKLEGYVVLRAARGHEGVEIARMERPDLILLDIVMPTLDGWETCKILKDDTQTSKIPVVIISALALLGHSEKAFEAGADDFLGKPFGRDELMRKVRKWLN